MYKNKSDLSQPARFYLIWQCLERLAGVENITVSFTLIFCYSPLSVWDSFVFNHVRQDKRVPESWEPAWLLTCLFWSCSLERPVVSSEALSSSLHWSEHFPPDQVLCCDWLSGSREESCYQQSSSHYYILLLHYYLIIPPPKATRI